MKKKKIIKKINKIKDKEQQKLLKEYIVFCNHASTEIFENYLKMAEDLEDFDFYCIIEFCFKNDLYNMLYRLLKMNHNRIVHSESLSTGEIDELELRPDFKERFNRFIFSK